MADDEFCRGQAGKAGQRPSGGEFFGGKIFGSFSEKPVFVSLSFSGAGPGPKKKIFFVRELAKICDQPARARPPRATSFGTSVAAIQDLPTFFFCKNASIWPKTILLRIFAHSPFYLISAHMPNVE
jgi:hypothetical protein